MNKKYSELAELFRSEKTDEEILDFLLNYHKNDIADMMAGMTEEERKRLYHLLGAQKVAEIFKYIEEPRKYIRGAVLVGGQVIVGRIRGVERPPLAPLIPTEKGVSLLLDCGANVDARPSMLVQFAKMGSVYMESVMGVKNPRVGIVNIGAEEEKGNALVKETFPLLKNCPEINFIGSVEARDIPAGAADVIVCEAFVGNVILKMYEGVSSALLHQVKQGMMSTLRSKMGALLVKPRTDLPACDQLYRYSVIYLREMSA